MSQRECAGFNWPPLSVSAAEPVSICPEAVNRAAPEVRQLTAARSGPWLRMASLIPPSVLRTPLSARDAVGVGQAANQTTRPSKPFGAALQ